MIDEINRFVNCIRRRSPNAHTYQDYRCDLQQFLAVVGDHPPDEIGFQDVDRFIADQSQRGLKPATINRRLTAVISLYTFLAAENPDLVCPVLPYRHMLRTYRRLPRPVPDEKLRRFLAVVKDSRDKAIFLLMLRCGLRISEAANLRLQDLYLNEARPRLLIHGKGSKERSVYLSPQAAFALRRYLAERPVSASESVFLNYKLEGLATIGIQKRLEKYRAEAGIHLTAHQLRHSFANDLVAAGAPVTTIQKLMGHTWVTTTQAYIAANDPKVQQDFYAAVKQMEGWQ
ncbi:MAG: tyrosine-type recombinase/integrase [Ardenticatenaceae bacterium]|nr:tyrosine-type recombinase/integrase [Anaerolineales bacterium]MCB8919967.1 tyrosine-type recombinase/integrase [Ardenticatenaceae bacterium]MCB8989814.1 tyrosine-type recombinase/integrase [Ardenticatenaceae bacterium]